MPFGLIGRFLGYRYGPKIAISAKRTTMNAETARPGVLTNSSQRLAARRWRERRRPCSSCSGLRATAMSRSPPDPRVDERVGQVRQDVGEDDRHDDEQERPVQDREV